MTCTQCTQKTSEETKMQGANAILANHKYNWKKDNLDHLAQKIVDLIASNQDFLCQPENLPQLAKMTYIFTCLHNATSMTFGYDWKKHDKDYDNPFFIKERKWGEDNPKDEFLDRTWNNDDNENLIYDAWCIHDEPEIPTFDELNSLLHDTKQLDMSEKTDYEQLSEKKNKTMDEWVKLLTDDRNPYRSIYGTPEAVYNHLLCTIGSGYGWNKDGNIAELGPSDQDNDVYNGWKTSKLDDKILQKIDSILSSPYVKLALDNAHNARIYLDERSERKEIMKDIEYSSYFLSSIARGKTALSETLIAEASNLQEQLKSDNIRNMSVNELKKIRQRITEIKDMDNEPFLDDPIENPKDYHKYYPVSDGSSPICTVPDNVNPAYLPTIRKVLFEICSNPDAMDEDYGYARENALNALVDLQKRKIIDASEEFQTMRNLWRRSIKEKSASPKTLKQFSQLNISLSKKVWILDDPNP